jgi:hypothetical protein
MTLKSWLAGLAGALTMGLVTMPAEAAPTGGLPTLKGAAAPTAEAQQAHWYGRRYGYRPYYYGYGPRRYGYYGYGPGYRYGYRHHRRHWYRW